MLAFPTLGDLPGPEIDPSPGSPALAGRFFATGAPWEAPIDNVNNNTIINNFDWHLCCLLSVSVHQD